MSASQKSDAIARISRVRYDSSKFLLVLAIAMFTLANVTYVTNRSAFFNPSASPDDVYVSLLLFIGGTAFLALAGVAFLRVGRKDLPVTVPGGTKISWSIWKIIADSFFENRRLIASTFVIYAVFFSLIDGILIFQPNVDFFSAYGINGIQAVASSCCGYPGYVPSISIFFPAQHIGLLVIPLNLLLMAIISSLVAINVTLLYRAAKLSNAMKSKGRGSLSILGAISGLFAGCPTCAAAFFLSMLAGSGATAFSIYISQYQDVMVALTLPLLVGSIWWQAKSIRILMEGCCV